MLVGGAAPAGGPGRRARARVAPRVEVWREYGRNGWLRFGVSLGALLPCLLAKAQFLFSQREWRALPLD